MEQNEIIELKIRTKKNLVRKLESTNAKIINLYVKEQNNGKPILYPLPQELLMVYKTIEKAIAKLNDEIKEQESAQQ